MGYEHIIKPEGNLYHYTKRENIDTILRDGRIRRFGDRECWFCTSLEDTLKLMEKTVMMEGKSYYGIGGILKRYPVFVPSEYVILKLEQRYQNGVWVRWNQELPEGSPLDLVEEASIFSHLKVGFRGELKFKENPEIIEVTVLLEEHQQSTLSMGQ